MIHLQILAEQIDPPRKSTSIHRKNQKDPLSRSKIKIRQSWDVKNFDFFLIFLNFENFRKHDFSKIIEIPLKIEKSSFRKKSKFSKIWKFSEIFKNFRDSTLTNFNFRSTQPNFSILFYESKRIFEADSMSLSEIAAKFTGKSYFTFISFGTAKQRNYIISRKTLLSFLK